MSSCSDTGLPFSCLSLGLLSDHLVRSRQHMLRNNYAYLLRSFEIYHQFKFCRLLYRKVGRLGSFQDSIHVDVLRAGIRPRGLPRKI